MEEPVTLALHLQLHDGVLEHVPPAGAARRLDADVAEELVERVAVLPRSAAVRLRVHVTPPPEDVAEQIPAVIRHHYAALRGRAGYRLQRTVRAGRFSLLVGSLVLLLALALAEILSRLLSGGVAVVLGEGLTIVGWVALWRPLDLLLFDRWALRRDIAVYQRLEQAEITVVGSPANVL